MLSFEEAGEILDAIAEELPKDFFRNLNGGILLLPEAKQNPDDSAYGLYILGEYVYNHLGRHIIIYYGSFTALFSHLSPERLRKELKDTLLHEFTHHIESMAGAHGLEIKDALELARMRSPHRYRIRRDPNP